MSYLFRGKFLVRKSKLVNGEDVIIFCGLALPASDQNLVLNSKDEMWVCDIEVKSGGVRFEEFGTTGAGSPEDFLSGMFQSQNEWKKKSEL
jgi:hypothetical protein